MITLLLCALSLAGSPEEAVSAYVAGDFARSAELGQALIDEGVVNGDVYYNLGGALYHEGRVPEAVLAWRKAQLLSPRDGDIQANLEHARRELKDRLDVPDQRSALFWRDFLSLYEQGWGAAVLLGMLGVMGVVWRLRPQTPLAIPAFLTGVPAILLAVSTAVELHELETRPGAVVLLDEVELRSAGVSGVVLFTLHAGAEVVLWEQVEGQAQVALPDGRRGWMPMAGLGVVRP